MHDMRTLFWRILFAAWPLVSIQAVTADDRSPLRIDLSIDAVAVGTARAKLSRPLEKSSQCLEDLRKRYFDCEYTTRSRLHITVLSQAVTSIFLDVSEYRGTIPFGLRRSDSVASGLATMRKVTKCRSCWRVIEYNDFGGKSVTSGRGFLSRHRIPYVVEIAFDETGQMRRIALVGESI
jgi:hypothetical protein